MDHVTQILSALERSGGRYVVVGGVAVVLHGHLRYTADLDLVVALDRPNALRTLGVLKALGFRPRPPVPIEDFADTATRESWIREKGLTVFSLWSDAFPGTDVDLFATEPIPFEALLERSRRLKLDEISVPVASIRDLVAMKAPVARPIDLADIAALEAIELSLKADEKDSRLEP